MINSKAGWFLYYRGILVLALFLVSPVVFAEGQESDLLTQYEKAWIASHPKIVFGVDGGWAPFIIKNSDGSYSGIDVDTVQRLNAILGINISFVTGKWADLVEKLKNRSIDGLSASAAHTERSEFSNFTNNYSTQRKYIYVKSDNPGHLKSDKDLAGKRIAYQKGNLFDEKTLKGMSAVVAVPVKNFQNNVGAVLSGEVDGFIGGLSTDYQIQSETIIHVKPVLTIDKKLELVFSIRKDWPELVSILNKGLAHIGEQERLAIINRYSSKILQSIYEPSVIPAEEINIYLYALILAVTLAVFAGVFWFSSRLSRSETLAEQFGSKKLRIKVIAAELMITLLIIILSWSALEFNRSRMGDRVAEELQRVFNFAFASYNTWLENNLELLVDHVQYPEFVAAVEQLSNTSIDQQSLKSSVAQKKLREFDLKHLNQIDIAGFYVISKDGLVLASRFNEDLGRVNPISIKMPHILDRGFQGEALIVPVINNANFSKYSDDVRDEDDVSMFIVAPVRNNKGKILALVAKRLSPSRKFTEILSTDLLGMTGETYIFDREGLLLSESRFDAQLRQIGLLQDKQPSALNIYLRDPGGNLLKGFKPTLPLDQRNLTRMANSAIKGNYDIDMKAYRDYRGVPVVGIWRWDDRYNFGITSEIDEGEAFESYYLMRWTLFGVLGLVLIVAATGVTYTLILGEHAGRMLRRSRDEMEELVQKRTAQLEGEIRERNAAEIALRSSQEKFRRFVVDIGKNFVIYSHDPYDGKILYASEGVEPIFGLPLNEVLGKSWVDMIEWDGSSKEKALLEFSHMVRGEKDFTQFELRFTHPDGGVRTVQVSSHPVRDQEEKLLSIDGIVEDISERVASQEQKDKQQKLRDILQQTTNTFVEKELTESELGFAGEVAYDNAGKPYLEMHATHNIEWNSKTHTINENSPGEEIGLHDFAFLVNEVLTKRVTVVNNEPRRSKSEIDEADGHKPLRSFLGVPVFYGDKIVGVYAVANRDNGYHEDLQELLRPFDMTYGVLIHSKRMAEQEEVNKKALVRAKISAEHANLAKSQFLSSMSHELRTPLNAIIGFAQLFEYQNDISEDHKENAREIYMAGEHLLSLINDVLDLSKIEAGILKLSMDDISLSQVLKECATIITPLAEMNSIALDFILDNCQDFYVKGDHTRLNQVFLNLLSNAVKYNRPKGYVAVTCEVKDNETVIIKIKDSGRGISDDNLKKLFQPFNRLGAEFGNIEGTGIGLVITRELVAMMGGKIGVSSTVGKGSTFWVEFKRVVHDIDQPDADVAGAENGLVEIEEVKNKRPILIAEDNLTNQVVLKQQMMKLGIKADFVDNGIKAWERLKSGDYDLLLTDIHMPLMDGYELTERIRKSELGTSKHMPIVAITANVMADDKTLCLKKGMDAHLGKPIRLEELRSVLNEWLPVNDSNSPSSALSPPQEPATTSDEKQNSGPIDYSMLKELVGEKPDKHCQVFQSFLKFTPEKVTKILIAQKDRKAASVGKQAHKMTSSARSIGANELADTCQALEIAGKNNNWDEIDNLCSTLEQRYDGVKKYMERYCESVSKNTRN